MYDISGATSDRNVVVLNDIHIDIMDYIVPASCTDTEFRQMWAEFEWENKVIIKVYCIKIKIIRMRNYYIVFYWNNVFLIKIVLLGIREH